jgi:DNA modification methylase
MPEATLYTGDAKDTLASLPAESVQTCVTSPPYHGLRNYGEDEQLGLEDTPQEYVENIADVFDEVRRVLRPSGTAWLNLGDAYARPKSKGVKFEGGNNDVVDQQAEEGLRGGGLGGLKEKDLKMLPSRVAMELQRRGWWVRSRIVWAKGVSFCDDYSGSCMPESVTDRPTSSHEYIFLLSKSKQYFYDADAIREESVKTQAQIEQRVMEDRQNLVNDDHQGERAKGKFQGPDDVDVQAGRNVRDVWTFSPKPFPEAHFAVYPPELIEPCVKAGTSKKGECPECGAPWERTVDHTPGEYDYSERGEQVGHDAQASGTQKEPAKRKTTGWKPTCGCNRAGEDLRDDAFEVIESPLSSRS